MTWVFAGIIPKFIIAVRFVYKITIIQNPGIISSHCVFMIDGCGCSGGIVGGKKVISIAGPWLYTFNQWALAYYIEQGVQAFIPPYEISRQDLYRLTEYLPAQFFAPIVFAYPDLFRIRADLSKKYGQANFIDRENNTFRLIGKRDYSVVVPERPFSITDLVPNLKKQGFRRFIVDLSNAEPSKGLYRDIARAVDQGS